MSRHVAVAFNTPRRKTTSPVRTLIDATFPALDPKQKSRWSRALEFAAFTKATPEQLPNLFKKNSGIAGCAREAAKQRPKKKQTAMIGLQRSPLNTEDRLGFQSFPVPTAVREGS